MGSPPPVVLPIIDARESDDPRVVIEAYVDRWPLGFLCRVASLPVENQEQWSVALSALSHRVWVAWNGDERLVPRTCVLHRKSNQQMTRGQWPDVRRTWGGSVHSLNDARQLIRSGGSYALLSPVASTASHPEAQPLSARTRQSIVRELGNAGVLVFALGGATPASCALWQSRGFYGVSGIRAFAP